MLLADLPYGTTANRWDSVIPFEPLWRELLRVCKPSAAMVFTASQPFTSALVMSQPKLFRHEWIWQKNTGSNFMSTVRDPMKEHESVLVFSRGGWTYNGQLEERSETGKRLIGRLIDCNAPSANHFGPSARTKKIRTELRVPSSVQRVKREVGLHPTQKPVPLFEYLIKTYSSPGEIILDPTCGSGTSAVAASNLGRRWICIERDSNYFNVARKRLEELHPNAPRKLVGALW